MKSAQNVDERGRVAFFALTVGVTSLAACQPVDRPQKITAAITPAESNRDAGAVPPPTDQPAKETGPSGQSSEESTPAIGGVEPSAAAGQATAACTGDAGSCSPLGDAGVDGGVTCPGCLIEGECVAADAVDPANTCQICDPQRSVQDWSSRDGVACNDGLYCTTDDVCTGTVCKGTPRQCEDGVACNGVATCDEVNGKCSDPTNQCGANAVCDAATDTCVSTCAGCLVNGVCVTNGTAVQGNSCLVCDPAQSTTSYSPALGKACGAAATNCSAQDTCNARGQCVANDLPAGTACGNPNSNDCDQADTCDGKGVCQQNLARNGTQCDDGQFCTTGDQCRGGICISGGPNINASCGAGLICNAQAQCVTQRCGDGVTTGSEVCDSGGSGSTDLGACNPDCTGFYEKKLIKATAPTFSSNLGGIPGADGICTNAFGAGWKALLVGRNRQATVTPLAGDGQLDWVLHKYTYYFNANDELVWRTDNVALLGVSGGQKQNLFAPLFDSAHAFPWSGYALDWTTLAESNSPVLGGTCQGWTSNTNQFFGSFITQNLDAVAAEACGTTNSVLCVQQ